MLSALELYERGVDLSNSGKHAPARRMLDAARTRTDDANLLARIDGTMAYIVLETGDPDAAAELCASALAASGLSAHTRAVLRGQQGMIELWRGETSTAMRLLTRSLNGLENDPARAAGVLLNRGLGAMELHRLEDAEADFAAAAQSFSDAGATADAAKALHNQGYAALLAGDLIAASRLMDAARPVAAASGPVDAAVGDVDRAEVLLAAGMPVEAARKLDAAIRVYAARRLRRMQADAEFRLARTLLYSDARRSARTARRAARRFRAYGNEVAALRADEVALRAEAGNGASPRLSGRLDAAAEELRRHGLRTEAHDLRLTAARVEAQRGHLEAAQQRLRGIRTPAQASIVSRTLAREVRAEVASQRDDSRAVLREARRGLDELAYWQATFGSLDLQSSFAMHGRRLVLNGIRAALATGRPDVAFEWSERARHIASHAVVPRPPEDPEVATALAELRQLAQENDADGRRGSELRDLVRSRRWPAGGANVVPRFAELADAQEAIGRDDAVLLAYLWDGEGLSVLVAEPASATIVPLGRVALTAEESAGLQAELDLDAGRLGGAAGAAIAASLRTRLEELSRRLVEPVLAASERAADAATRLVIVVPGILAGVPWTMLPALASRRITLPTSATRWVRQSAAPHAVPQLSGFVAGPDVPRAVDEANGSAAAWAGSSILSGKEATTERAAGLAAAVDVLHVIGHGRHAVDNPHFSGVELADGTWFGYDVEQLPRTPQVVLLSACELGRSSVDWGHEALGMARSWLHAGARCVVASPANVNDEDARALLPEMHARLAAGEPPAGALAAATEETGVVTPFLCYGAAW